MTNRSSRCCPAAAGSQTVINGITNEMRGEERGERRTCRFFEINFIVIS
jgi:hypothetical protein